MDAVDLLSGIDLDGLAHDVEAIELPPVQKNRVVHIDADFLAYQVSYEKADGTDTKTIDDMKHNAEIAVETLRGLAAAEFVHLHLTPSDSNKGGRFEQALLKEYQANRADKEKPRYLNIIRNWLEERYNGTQHRDCEADDGMSSAQYKAIDAGSRNLSIIASKDKDLSMVPGLHLDWDRGSIHETETDYGSLWLYEKRSASGVMTKKVKGYGQKFFWAQMLMGDQADNISGLPKVVGSVLNKVSPTQAIENAYRIIENPISNAAMKAKAQRTIDERKAAACGPVMAMNLLADVNNNKDAFNAVRDLYQKYGETVGFTHWQTGAPVDWTFAFVSEARLLWMRRDRTNPDDVLNWWRTFL